MTAAVVAVRATMMEHSVWKIRPSLFLQRREEGRGQEERRRGTKQRRNLLLEENVSELGCY